MHKKSLFATGLICVLTICLSVTCFAKVEIFVDLEKVLTDTVPQIVNDRTMVPVRAITEMIGCRVEWIEDKQQVEIYSEGSKVPTIIMQIGNEKAYYTKFDAESKDSVGVEITLDAPPIIINERTFVPLRFISEAINYTVDYNVDSADIYIFSPRYLENQIGEGKGNDEGIGEVTPITEKEINYLLSLRTKSWLALTDEKKQNAISLLVRWLEQVDGYVVEDFDVMLQDLDHQMETYFRNNVDAGIFETACDIYKIDINNYIKG